MASEKLSAALEPFLELLLIRDGQAPFYLVAGKMFSLTARAGAQLSDTASRCSSFCGIVQRRDPHLSSEQPKPSDVVAVCRRVHSPGFGVPVPQGRDFSPERASDWEDSPARIRLLEVPRATPYPEVEMASFYAGGALLLKSCHQVEKLRGSQEAVQHQGG